MNQFIPALEAAGATVTVEPYFSEQYLNQFFTTGKKNVSNVLSAVWRRRRVMSRIRLYDLVWLEKEVYPFLPAYFEDQLSDAGVPYVVDFDDATFHTYDLSNNRLVRSLLGTKLQGLIAGARAVTVGNQYLENYVSRVARGDIVRVPTVVDIDRYPVLPFPGLQALQVGWIGTPNNARYLKPVIQALEALKGQLHVELITVGSRELLRTEGHSARQWHLENESADVGSFDVGVMPIPDEPWERGKCGYKLIQYMAGGRPVIASPVGINREIVTADVGFLAANHDQWVQAISELANDPVKAVMMGKAARATVERNYSLQAMAPRIVETLQRAIGR